MCSFKFSLIVAFPCLLPPTNSCPKRPSGEIAMYGASRPVRRAVARGHRTKMNGLYKYLSVTRYRGHFTGAQFQTVKIFPTCRKRNCEHRPRGQRHTGLAQGGGTKLRVQRVGAGAAWGSQSVTHRTKRKTFAEICERMGCEVPNAKLHLSVWASTYPRLTPSSIFYSLQRKADTFSSFQAAQPFLSQQHNG